MSDIVDLLDMCRMVIDIGMDMVEVGEESE
jgi:hypothetical protein